MAAKKPKKKPSIPQSSEAKAARQALIQADLLGLASDRSRLAELSRGAYSGGPRLRAGGTEISSRYRIGDPKADKGFGKRYTPPPAPGTKRKPKSTTKIGLGKPGSGKRMIAKSGGGAKDLAKWRGYTPKTRTALKKRARTTNRTLTQIVRQRGAANR